MNFDPTIPHNPVKKNSGVPKAEENPRRNSSMFESNADQNAETKNPMKGSGMLRKSAMNVKGVYNPKANYKTPASRSSISSESSAGVKEEPIISPFVQAQTKAGSEPNSTHHLINIQKPGQSLGNQAENAQKPIINPQRPMPKEMISPQSRSSEQEEEKKKGSSSNPPTVLKNSENEPSPLNIPSQEPIKNPASKAQGNPSQNFGPFPKVIKNPEARPQEPESAPQKKLDMSAGVKVQYGDKKSPEFEPAKSDPVPQVKPEARPKIPAPVLGPKMNQEIPKIGKNQEPEIKIPKANEPFNIPKAADPSKNPRLPENFTIPKATDPSKNPKLAEPFNIPKAGDSKNPKVSELPAKSFEIPKKVANTPPLKEEEKKPLENQPKGPGKNNFFIPKKINASSAQSEVSEPPISVKLKMVPFSEFKPKGQLVQNLNPKANLVPIFDESEKYSVEPADLSNSDISDLIELFLLQLGKANQNILDSESKVAEIIYKYAEDNPEIKDIYSKREICGDCKHPKEKTILNCCDTEVCKKCTNKELASKTNFLMLPTEYDNISIKCDYCGSPYTESEYSEILGRSKYEFYKELRDQRSVYQYSETKGWEGKEDAFKSARINRNSLITNKCKSCKKVKRLADFYDEECCRCLCKDCYATIKYKGERICPYCSVELNVKDIEIQCKACDKRVKKIERCMRELCCGHNLCMDCLKISKDNMACAFSECRSALTEVQLLELKRFFKKIQKKA